MDITKKSTHCWCINCNKRVNSDSSEFKLCYVCGSCLCHYCLTNTKFQNYRKISDIPTDKNYSRIYYDNGNRYTLFCGFCVR
jgi:hypothetical protein